MTFTTLTFVVFLVVVFALYWLVERPALQNLLLVVASYFFYGWWDYRFCGLMFLSSTIDYAVGLGLERLRGFPKRRHLLLVGSVAANLGLLGFFKYFNFFVENLQRVLAALGWTISPMTLRLVLPVGISFYTFQSLSYVLDVYRGQIPATHRFLDYLAYVSFFPQLVAGPIERGTNLLPQFQRARRFDPDQAADGCRQMLWGFFKKMVIADNLAPLVERVYAQPGESAGGALLAATVFFAFQIYSDFSAYSDIASGTARCFGFSLMRNFAYPYFAQDLGEFWRRWHISLTTWFRDYVYWPMGGSRVPPVRRAGNILATFLLSGLWHGASWNYVLWGLINGLAVLPSLLRKKHRVLKVTDIPGGEERLPAPMVGLRMAATFAVVCCGWIFFRAQSLSDAWLILKKAAVALPSLDGPAWAWNLCQVESPLGAWLLLLLALLIGLEWSQRRQLHPLSVARWPIGLRWACYFALALSVLMAGTFNSGQFIYFQF